MTSWCRLQGQLSCFDDSPLGSLRHVPSNVAHLLAFGQELVEVFDTLAVLGQELGLAWHGFLALDQVEDENWRTVAAKKVVKVLGRRSVEWVLDCDCAA